VIAVPLRPAFLEGTTVANGFKPGDFAPVGDLIRLIGQMNDQVWLKQTRIAFRAAVSAGVPAIEDPDDNSPAPDRHCDFRIGCSAHSTRRTKLLSFSAAKSAYESYEVSYAGEC
jgi:hypothetical protein